MLTDNLRLLRPLGQGAMGTVWLAEHQGLMTEVAVKLLLPDETVSNPKALARFRQEAALAAKLRCPHAVQVFDFGVVDDETPYLVMELLEGESLAERLAREQKLSPQQTALIVSQVAIAIDKARGLGIVHRDLKPSNLFLVQTGYDLFVKVLDFGIAKQLDTLEGGEQLTDTGTTVGTPHYMSPEQLLAKELDHRADLWSLAIVAFHCLTGTLPYSGKSLADLAIHVCMNEPPSVNSVDPSLPAPLDAWFRRALAQEPEDRFVDPSEMARTFEAAIQPTDATDEAAIPFADTQASSDDTLAAPITSSQAAENRASPPSVQRTRRLRLGLFFSAIGASVLGLGVFLMLDRNSTPQPSAATGSSTATQKPTASVSSSMSSSAPTARSQEPSLARFNPGAYMAEAVRLAKQRHADAVLIYFKANGIESDGHIDLVAKKHQGLYTAYYGFGTRSKSGCINVMVSGQGTQVVETPKSLCMQRLAAGIPSCTPLQVIKKASSGFSLPSNSLAEVSFMLAPGSKKAKWNVTVGKLAVEKLPDDCPPTHDAPRPGLLDRSRSPRKQ